MERLPISPRWWQWLATPWGVLAAAVVALLLRLVVWQWYEQVPLGGDEQEYLQQALTLLQERRYTELLFMRPPLYGVFLAAIIYGLGDSLIQPLRLVQAVISAAMVVPIWLLTRELLTWYRSSTIPTLAYAPTVAALLCAFSYTLAARATELLSETLFVTGLSVAFWLIVRAGNPELNTRPVSAAAAGVVLALLCLTRSVAVVLVPLAVAWLLIAGFLRVRGGNWWVPAVLCGALAVLFVAPWTVRNAVTYGAPILIDTTGAENLWLDNDPAGREAVKEQLFALGDDRAERQRQGMANGVAVILNNPAGFAVKAWGELVRFVALEHSDDMRDRPEIWVPLAQVWARLLLGDALWLLTLLAGVLGIAAVPLRRPASGGRWLADPRWLLALWLAYTTLTVMVFHVELRYRLPLYPVLLPFAAVLLCGGAALRRSWRRTDVALGGLLLVAILSLMLLHRPYIALAYNLGWKHWHLGRAAAALQAGTPDSALQSSDAARRHDPERVLWRTAAAQAQLQRGDIGEAERLLREAVGVLPDHPQANLLLADALRVRGDPAALDEARARFGQYETATRQDTQAWGWAVFASAPPPVLAVGAGLDLGFVQGMYAAETFADIGARWTRRGTAQVRLAAPTAPTACPEGQQGTQLVLRWQAPRPAGVPQPTATVRVNGATPVMFAVPATWDEVRVPLDAAVLEPTNRVEIGSDTYAPRQYDRTSNDGRTLGVLLDSVGLVQCDAPE